MRMLCGMYMRNVNCAFRPLVAPVAQGRFFDVSAAKHVASYGQLDKDIIDALTSGVEDACLGAVQRMNLLGKETIKKPLSSQKDIEAAAAAILQAKG